MGKKSFQIIMNETTHAQLKNRAKDYNVNIGDFIGELLSSFEVRMDTAYRILGFQEDDFPYANGIMLFMLKTGLLEKEMTEKNKKALKEKGKTLLELAKLDGFEPKSILPEDENSYKKGQDK